MPRIGRHAVAVLVVFWTMLAIPWLRSFSSPLNCRQAADPTGSVVMVMASDTAVRCDATDPAYSAATAAMSDSLVKAAALFVIATAVFALLPSSHVKNRPLKSVKTLVKSLFRAGVLSGTMTVSRKP